MHYLALVAALAALLLAGSLAESTAPQAQPMRKAPSAQEATPAATVCDIDFERPAFLYVLKGRAPDGQPLPHATLVQARTVIDDRVAAREFDVLATFTLAPRIPSGSDQIEVGLKRIRQEGVVERLLQQEGLFEIVDAKETLLPRGTKVTTSLRAATAVAAGTATPSEPVLQTELSSSDVIPSSVQFDGSVIRFVLTDEGSRAFGDFTANHIGQTIAVLLDSQVIWSTTVERQLSGGLVMSALPKADARTLAIVLRSGPLPAPLQIASRSPLPAAVICQ